MMRSTPEFSLFNLTKNYWNDTVNFHGNTHEIFAYGI